MISNEYIAGFFDGEGCVNISQRGKRHNPFLRVMITNTDPFILQIINQQFGGKLATPRILGNGWKVFRQLVFTGKEAFEFLLAIQPFAIIKKPQISLAIDFWLYTRRSDRYEKPNPMPKTYGGNRRQLKPSVVIGDLEFKAKMHQLNRKGLA